MKKIIALLAVVTGIGFITPTESSARDYCHNDRRIVSYQRCGAPVYAVYQVYGRDRHGHVLGRWVTQYANHSSCGRCNPRSSYGHGGHHDHHNHHSSHGHRSSSSRGGFSIFFGR